MICKYGCYYAADGIKLRCIEFRHKDDRMTYYEVVKKAQAAERTGFGTVQFAPCETWLAGDQINLWTYWQGYQLKDIDQKGVDILLVGQDWGNPNRNPEVIRRIERIQSGSEQVSYLATASPTDKTMIEMFKVFGDGIDITKASPRLRLFFTNYSLGYRTGSETGGMAKRVMRQDTELFNDLVLAIKPKIIICLGKITFEMVTGTIANGFVKRLREGAPFKTAFPLDSRIPVYSVAHCGSRGKSNVGGEENMRKAWERIAEESRNLFR